MQPPNFAIQRSNIRNRQSEIAQQSSGSSSIGHETTPYRIGVVHRDADGQIIRERAALGQALSI